MSGKVTWLDMILFVEGEKDRLDCCVEPLVGEARAYMERRALIARRTVQVLDLLREHDQQVAEIFRAWSEAKERRAAKANR
jgi:hypothetical protein